MISLFISVILFSTTPVYYVAEEKPLVAPIVIEAEVSYYTSSVDETDDTPFITANNTRTRDGIIANNCLEFGTKVIVETKVYEVTDRMNRRYGCEHFDIWVKTKKEAYRLGRRELIVEIYAVSTL